MKKNLAFILFALSFLSLKAEPFVKRNYSYRYYSTRDGLVQKNVLCAFQDWDGYIWFGTTGGVSRFDGFSFKNFTAENGLPNGNVYSIGEWDDKIVLMYQTKMVLINADESISILQFPYGLVVSKQKKTIMKLDNNRLLILNLHSLSNEYNFLPRHFIYSLKEKKLTELKGFNEQLLDYNKNFLVTSTGLFRRDGFRFKRMASFLKKYQSAELNWNNMIFFMREESKHHIDKYRLNKNRIIYQGQVTATENGDCMTILPDGTFLSFDKKMNGQFYPSRKTGLGLQMFNPSMAIVDRENNLWICTENGIYNYFNLNIEEYRFNLGYPDYIWSILEDNDRNIWLGSFGNGLWKMNGAEQLTPMFATMNSSLQYMGSSKSNNGTLFFPTSDGIIKYSKYEKPTQSNTSACMFVYYDEKNQKEIYSGVDTTTNTSGIYHGVGAKKHFYKWDHSFAFCAVRDSRGNIRLGSHTGQAVFTGNSIVIDTAKHDYQSVISMSIDNKGRLWKGTDRGVYVELSNGKEFRLSGDRINGVINSLMVYRNKYLLVGGSQDLIIVDIQHLTTYSHPELFEIGINTGFAGFESGQNGFCEDHNGDVWLATRLYVMKFNPEKLVQAQTKFIPTVRLLSLSYSKNNRDWKQVFFNKRPIIINHINRFFRFEFVSNSILAPNSIRFKYRLKGLADDWTRPINSESVVFTNLDYGKYQLEVQCSLDGENWSKISLSPEIEILSPWWATLWAKLLYVFWFSAVIVLVTLYIVKSGHEKKLTIIKRNRLENELQLNSLRSKIIPHFTKNVLSAIGYFAMTDKLKAGYYISVFSKFTQLTLANSDKSYVSLQEEINYLNTYLDLEKMRFGERFDYKVTIEDVVNLEVLIPSMILHTYCDNAIRHGFVNMDGNGFLEVVISRVSVGLLISVIDNGIGRQKAQELGTRGNGLGLSLVQAQFDFYNQNNTMHITQKIVDRTDDEGRIIGLMVEVFIPECYEFGIA